VGGTIAVDPLLLVSLRDGGFEFLFNLRETILVGELSEELRDASEEVGEAGSSTTGLLAMRSLGCEKLREGGEAKTNNWREILWCARENARGFHSSARCASCLAPTRRANDLDNAHWSEGVRITSKLKSHAHPSHRRKWFILAEIPLFRWGCGREVLGCRYRRVAVRRAVAAFK
jgi:hypothetical protein